MPILFKMYPLTYLKHSTSMDKNKKLYHEIEKCRRLNPAEPVSPQDLKAGGFVTMQRALADSLIIEMIDWASDKNSLYAILDHYDQIFENWHKEKAWSEIKDLLILANSQICHKVKDGKSLTGVHIKWIEEWFRAKEQSAPAGPPVAAEVAPVPASVDFDHMKSFEMESRIDLERLYHFLEDEKVINDISVDLFSKCIVHGYLNPLWEHGVEYKLKRMVFHLKKHFKSSAWFDNVIKHLDKSKGDMSKTNFGPDEKGKQLRDEFDRKIPL